MGYFKAGLVSLAASALFVVLDIQLLGWGGLPRWLGATAVFLVACALLWRLHPSSENKASEGRTALSNNRVGNDFEADIEESKISSGNSRSVLSNNKIGKNAKVRIKKSQI